MVCFHGEPVQLQRSLLQVLPVVCKFGDLDGRVERQCLDEDVGVGVTTRTLLGIANGGLGTGDLIALQLNEGNAARHLPEAVPPCGSSNLTAPAALEVLSIAYHHVPAAVFTPAMTTPPAAGGWGSPLLRTARTS